MAGRDVRADLLASRARTSAGIYTDAGTSGCSGQGVGSYGHYQQDVDQFASWGFDADQGGFLRRGTGVVRPAAERPSDAVRAVLAGGGCRSALDDPERLQLLDAGADQRDGSLIRGLFLGQFSWAPAVAQSWRTDTDIGYKGNIQFQWVLRNLDQDSTPVPEHSERGGPSRVVRDRWGHWNDPDYLGPGLGMTSTQAQSQFSMWAMVAAPLILGSDPRSLSSTSINMLKNLG